MTTALAVRTAGGLRERRVILVNMLGGAGWCGLTRFVPAAPPDLA